MRISNQIKIFIFTAILCTVALGLCACNNAVSYSLIYFANGGGEIVGESLQTVKQGEDGSTITAIPIEGYIFMQWSDGIKTATRTDENVHADIIVTAQFAKITLTACYLTDGNGELRGETTQTFAYGENATSITAVPNEGYEFVQWSDGKTAPTRTDENVQSDITVTAIFQRITSTVTYFTDGNGTIQGEPTQTVAYGKNATSITAVPNTGYEFLQWSDGLDTAMRTDEDIKSNIDVTAIFVEITFTVRYVAEEYIYGGLWEENVSYDVMFLQYTVAYGKDAPVVMALPRQNQSGDNYVFLYWSDGVTTEQRQDTDIKADLTVTAFFGYKIVYTATDGGKITGETEQKLLPDGITSGVTAVPDEGYVFCGWSDLSWQTSRSGDFVEKAYHSYHAEWEYIAYFEPIKKTFNYNYGIAAGTPLSTQITLNRNNIQSMEFTVPSCAGYTFCGWYADSDYRTRITTESGRYMYGYAAFSLETDTLYAKWLKQGEEPDNHKILLIFVDEVQTELYSTVIEQTINVHSKMTALDYELGKWTANRLYDLLNEWFADKVNFEVDSYYTTTVVKDGFTGGIDSTGNKDYTLYASEICEVAYLAYSYHNTITVFGLDDYELNLIRSSGTAGIKHACVPRDRSWYPYIINHIPLQDQMEKWITGEADSDGVFIDETCLHEFAHTAEMNFNNDYGLHDAISYAIRKYGVSNKENTIKPYLLGEFEMDGVICGVPAEYWNHEITISVAYHARLVDSNTAGKIKLLSENESDSIIKQAVSQRVEYGGEVTVEAIPLDGYRFVYWSDGVTTAIRHDTNIIAYYYIWAIFEKI